MEAAHGGLSQNIYAGIAMGAESMAPARTQHQPRSTNTNTNTSQIGPKNEKFLNFRPFPLKAVITHVMVIDSAHL